MSQPPATYSMLVIDDNEDDALLLEERLAALEDWRINLDHLLDPAAAAEQIDRDRPDLVFLDYRLGPVTGVELLVQLRASGIRCPVIVLTGQGDEYIAAEISRAGADAYLVKDDLNTARLPETMRRVLDQAERDAPRREEYADTNQKLQRLTPRENEVLNEIVAGLTNKQIAAKLHRSIETIKVHRSHIMAKIEADSTADLVRRVMTARLG